MRVIDFQSIRNRNSELQSDLEDYKSALAAYRQSGAQAIAVDHNTFDADQSLDQQYAERQLDLVKDDYVHTANINYALLLLINLQNVSLNHRNNSLERSPSPENLAAVTKVMEEIGKTQAFYGGMKERLGFSNQAIAQAGMDISQDDEGTIDFVRQSLPNVSEDMDAHLWIQLQNETYAILCEELNALAETQMDIFDNDLAYTAHSSDSDLDSKAHLPESYAENLLDQADSFLRFAEEYLKALQTSLEQKPSADGDVLSMN